MSRWITIPKPTIFQDPITGEVAKVTNEQGERVDAEPKTHEWYLHTFVLSHPVFSMRVGGYDAVHAAKQIAAAVDGLEEGKAYEVTPNQLAMMKCTFAAPSKKDEAKSAADAIRDMTNYEAMAFFDQMDAIMNASTKKPEDPDTPDTEPVSAANAVPGEAPQLPEATDWEEPEEEAEAAVN